MTYYTVCPTCGYKLLKAGDGTIIEICCPKCGERMTIKIKDEKVVIQKIFKLFAYASVKVQQQSDVLHESLHYNELGVKRTL